VSSPHDVIDMVIGDEKQKAPAGITNDLMGLWWRFQAG
jgi:hypothetical protein